MTIKRIQTTVRLEYENGKTIVQQAPFQPVKGMPGANHLQQVIALLRQQHQSIAQALQQYGAEGIYKRSQLTLTRMKRAKQRSRNKAAAVVESPPGETTAATDATGE